MTAESESKADTAAIDRSTHFRRMAAFAVMTVDWSQQSRSYLDNFLNYVLATFPIGSPTALSRQAIRPLIIEQFNLKLPDNIIQQLLKRAQKLGYVQWVGEQGVRLTPKGEKEVAPIPYTLKKLAQDQENLSQNFAGWSESVLGFQMDTARAGSILLNYVETYYCSLMSLADGRNDLERRLPRIEPTPEQKMAAAYITEIADTDADHFETIANMARGSMMVSALYAPTLVDTTRGFKHTTIYLDSKVAFRALGYEGEAAEQSTRELVTLLKRQGARVAVFDFTLREIRSVVDAVGQKAGNGSLWMARPGSVESYFYRLDAPRSLIEQHSVRLEGSLQALGIDVDGKPSYQNHRYVVDETEIESALRQGNPNYRPSALQHDVELITAIVRARGGRARASLEESKATFVTMNSLVVSVARSAQRRYSEDWPIVMFEADVAALTWIKEPLAAPELPRRQLIATSLGLTNPGKQNWSLYIGEIERLLNTTEITDNDLVLLRQKYEMDRLAFVSAPNTRQSDARSAVSASIASARAELTAELTAPLRTELTEREVALDEKTGELERQASKIEELESQLTETTGERRSRSEESNRLLRALLAPVWFRGTLLKWSVFVLFTAISVGAFLITYTPGAESVVEKLPFGDWILWGVRAVAIVAAIAGGLTGPFWRLGNAAQRRYLLFAIGRRDIEPERAAEVGFSFVDAK